MKLIGLNYKENTKVETKNPWSLSGTCFDKSINLVIGKNSTGKTRALNVIYNLALVINSQMWLNGFWKLVFEDIDGNVINYHVEIFDSEVILESIIISNQELLKRNKNSAHIYSETTKKMIDISPPHDKLVLHVRRDQKEYPFLELIANWANKVHGLKCSHATNEIAVDKSGKFQNLGSLGVVPSIVDQMSANSISQTIKDLKSVEFDVTSIATTLIPELPPSVKPLAIGEYGLPLPIRQTDLSNGMFRTIALLCIVNFFLYKNSESNDSFTFLIDDIGEGLDPTRSTRLLGLLIDKFKSKPQHQLILTSNDYLLINSIDIRYLTVLNRQCTDVSAFSYLANKEKFDAFSETGLRNFDILLSEYLT